MNAWLRVDWRKYSDSIGTKVGLLLAHTYITYFNLWSMRTNTTLTLVKEVSSPDVLYCIARTNNISVLYIILFSKVYISCKINEYYFVDNT